MSISLLESLDRLIASAPKMEAKDMAKCKKCGKPCKHGKLCPKCESEQAPDRSKLAEDEDMDQRMTKFFDPCVTVRLVGNIFYPADRESHRILLGVIGSASFVASEYDEVLGTLRDAGYSIEDISEEPDEEFDEIPSTTFLSRHKGDESIESQIDALVEKKAHRKGKAPKKTRASDSDDPKGQAEHKRESIESMIDEKLRKMCGKPEHEKWPIHTHGKKSHKKVTRYAKVMGGGSIPGWGDKHEALDERRKPGQCFKTVRKALGREHKGGDKDALAAWIKRKNTHESTRDRVEHAIDQLMS